MNNPLSMILNWLRVGYPDGVPPKDFYPLLALLTHNLSEEELERIIHDLQRENPEGDVTQEDVRGAIGRVTSAPVTEDHTREVAERLADAGWPVDEESAEVARAVAADGGVERVDHSRRGVQVDAAESDAADGTRETDAADGESAPRWTAEPADGSATIAPRTSAPQAADASASTTQDSTAPDDSTVPEDATAPSDAAPLADTGALADSAAPADAAAASSASSTPVTSAPASDLPPAPSSSTVQRILDWLSAGYPAGIPATDRLPLLALLRRQLTDDEAREIASHLVDEAGHRIVDPTDAGVAITRYTNDLPTEQEMRRVAEHLAVQGWPLGERR
ncbi:DUF3349 domain-containing protein [Brachybacterium halotolerans]|uniref:DUF3349 domain-containing protein n=1 Tax=Brachybacterium halotolerans TaxID=2795215 RepID=UPI001FE69C86|nr:DUF3349 domain-containing protein [Brachybacterium halotolerans]